jgi:hypothetical protein
MTTITDLETEAREAALANGVSEKQFNFVIKLARERVFVKWGTSPDDRVATSLRLFASGTIQRGNASRLIDELLSREYARGDAGQLKPAVYEKDGVTYVVKQNKAKTNVYAKRLVEIGGDRLTEADTVVKFDFVYAPGVIHQLTAEDQMPLERAKELMIRYGKCVNCGRPLKAAVSVERGIGPVCIKAFR